MGTQLKKNGRKKRIKTVPRRPIHAGYSDDGKGAAGHLTDVLIRVVEALHRIADGLMDICSLQGWAFEKLERMETKKRRP